MADVIDIAIEAGGFKTFVAAVQAAGLDETLKGKGPFTIFVPDDAAFAMLPAGTVDELLKNVPKLKAILMYHVLPGKFTVDEIAQMKTAKTIQGQEVKIDAAHWWSLHFNPIINDEAHMISTDIITDNGIIHVLNRVLMPNMELTCPVCGMGFMNMEEMNTHTKTAHVIEKTPESPPSSGEMPMAEKAAEPIQTAEVMPVVEKAPEPMLPAQVQEPMLPTPEPEPMLPTEVTPVVEKVPEPMPPTEPMPIVEKMPEPTTTAEVVPEPVSATAKAVAGVFEIIRDADRKFRFHLKATNGLIIAVSQSYGTREAAVKGIASIMKNAPMAKVVDRTSAGGAMPEIKHAGIVQDPVFEIMCDVGGKVRFHLKAANGLIIAASQSYGTRESAEKGIASIKKNAPMAKVVDHTMAAT